LLYRLLTNNTNSIIHAQNEEFNMTTCTNNNELEYATSTQILYFNLNNFSVVTNL